jgi:DnaJ-class molecular chaperone
MKKASYSSTATSVCTDCNGEGHIVIKGEHLGHSRYAADTKEPCETCEGSGMVTVDKQTVVTITAKHPSI